MTIAYLNHSFIDLQEARVSAMDRGFLFGDGVYEIVPVYFGNPFRLQQHFQRLKNSLNAIRLSYEFDESFWGNIFNQLIEKNGGGDQTVYLQITRGATMVREHIFPKNITPTVFAYSQPLIAPTLESLSQGIAVITQPDLRWKRCDIKSLNLLANVLQRQSAVDAGAIEALLIRDNKVVEGTSSNVFIVRDQVIITPAHSHAMLGGITRDLVVELAHQQGITLQESDIPVATLQQADEIWITSSTKEIMPVVQLDGKPVKDGKAGAIWRTMIKAYQDYKLSLK